jgi:menaquinone-specific isochorismate synthase
MTAALSATSGSLQARGRLRSRTRVLADGEVADLLDVLDPDGFAWIRNGAGFVTAGVAARIAVGTGPDRFAQAADLVAEALQSIEVDGPAPSGEAGPGAGPLAVGALPFDDRTPGSLIVPALVVLRRADGTGWITTIGLADSPGSSDPERITHRYGG